MPLPTNPGGGGGALEGTGKSALAGPVSGARAHQTFGPVSEAVLRKATEEMPGDSIVSGRSDLEILSRMMGDGEQGNFDMRPAFLHQQASGKLLVNEAVGRALTLKQFRLKREAIPMGMRHAAPHFVPPGSE